jgi:transposase-like protein
MATKNATGSDLTLMTVMARFSTEEAARAYFEGVRWANGRTCPHCGNAEESRIYTLTANRAAKIRPDMYKCAECKDTFTVTVGTVMEDSHVPLNKWLIAFYMMCASKTQISALQLQRQLEIGSYHTALFLCHRIRFALADIFPSEKLTGIVEADETYLGGKMRGRGRGYVGNKTPVVSLIERGGRVRSRVVDHVTGEAITKLLKEHVNEEASLHTDESPLYTKVGKEFTSHETVNHSVEEYARTAEDGVRVTTNTAEGFFGNSKRSIDGTHHSISRKHTSLYFAELDHKYNTRKMTDGERTVVGIRRMEGKRLMLHAPKRKAI